MDKIIPMSCEYDNNFLNLIHVKLQYRMLGS